MNRQSVPALLDHRGDYVVGRQHVSARLVEVQRLRSQYAALIIGDGLFSSGWSEADDVLTDLAEARTEQQCAALDRLLAGLSEISLLKIDVQGYEKRALAGAKQTLSKTKFLLVELNFMPQYDGGSWFGDVHEILTRDFGFFLANVSRPQVLNGRASMCDGLYVNPVLVREWVKPDFV